MLVDLDYDIKTNQVQLLFELDTLTKLKDYKNALYLIKACAYDFDLDPELTLDDLEEICEKTAELGKDKFRVLIGPEEIEVDI